MPEEVSVKEIDIVVTHEAGLHLRPAALFVQTAAAFQADVRVRNNAQESGFKNAKSALEVMMLGVNQGDSITLQADGVDEEQAIEALKTLIEGNFSQTPPASDAARG